MSSVERRVQNNLFGVNATKKNFEREAVAKTIFKKFGMHLVSKKHRTMLGYGDKANHDRKTNEKTNDDTKMSLLNSKNSTMRS